MSILITSDSTCDLNQQQIQQHGILILPLVVVKGGEQFHDGVDIGPDDIYAHVAAGNDLCSTAALNVTDYTEFFTEALKDHEAIIHLNISSHFSSCHQNARLAAMELENLKRVESELEWFTLKFDYRNADKPWGNSKDAPDRAINKLMGACVGEDAEMPAHNY